MIIKKSSDLKDIMKISRACSCDKCRHGCKFGSGILAEEDLGRISSFLGKKEEKVKEELLETIELFNREFLRPKQIRKNGLPYGMCVFFDPDKGCKIHPVKPLQCKIAMGCGNHGEDLMIWFMLNYLIDYNDAEAMRQYKSYLLSGGKTIPE